MTASELKEKIKVLVKKVYKERTKGDDAAIAYDVPVILHTDHCAKKLLPWVDGLLDEVKTFTKYMVNRCIAHT